MYVENPEQLVTEIEHCLLNKQSFSACGQDFPRKLNAIRNVIVRGDWQTPAALVLQSTKQHNEQQKSLLTTLNEAQAEKIHFSRLLTNVDEHDKKHFELIISRAKEKIKSIELALNQEMDSIKQTIFN